MHGTTINYEFESMEMKLMNVEKSFPISSKEPSIGNSQNFVILATSTVNGIDIEIIDSSTMLVTQKFKLQGEVKSVSTIKVVMQRQNFLIIHETSSQQGISAFRYKPDEGKFMEDAETTFYDQQAEFQYASDFLVVRTGNRVKVLQLGEKTWEIQEFNFNESIIMYTNRDFIAIHEGKKLHLIHKKNDIWTQNLLKSDFNGSTTALERFDITSDLQSKLKNLYQFQEGLQIHENLVLWSETVEEFGKFYKKLRVLMLDSNFKIHKERTISALRENISDIKESKEDSKGYTYTIGYRTVDNKYRVGVNEVCCDDKLNEEFNTKTSEQTEDVKKTLIGGFNNDQSPSLDDFRNSFLFNSDEKYRVILAANEVHLGEDH